MRRAGGGRLTRAGETTHACVLLRRRYNELLRETAPGVASKTLFVPYQTDALSGLVARLPEVYGRHSAAVAASAAPPQPTASGAGLTPTTSVAVAPRRAAAATMAPGAFKELD